MTEQRALIGDHPRIRGEHEDALAAQLGQEWIIPAYAGSTLAQLGERGCEGDHPRIRGEHLARGPVASRPVGSSPHTRGAPRACGSSR